MSLLSLFTPFTLPLASFLAIPMLSSWSTSLNLLFLSVAWTTIAASYSPLQLELFAPFVLRVSLYILPSLFFLLFDIGLPSLAVEFKSQGECAVPGRRRQQQQQKKKKGRDLVSVRRVVAWSCANVLLAVVVQAGLEFCVTDVLRMRSLLFIKGSNWGLNHLPNPWTMIKHGIVGLLSRNILQYYIHARLLHSASSGILAEWHQEWHHSIKLPYSFAANYDHPVCHLLHRFAPLYLPAIALRMHILTYMMLVAVFSLEETFAYSGYNVLPSTIMLKGMARRCDLHMMSEGEGNYGPLGVLDWCHGTTLGKSVMEDLDAELEKHNAEESAAKAVDGASEAASSLAEKVKGRMRKTRAK